MKACINNSNDDHLSPQARKLIGTMRGDMVERADGQPMPDRFTAIPHPGRPAMIICDEQSGRSTTVGLYAYRAMREALNDLFG